MLDAGRPITGFRDFKEDRMTEVTSADNLFHLIPAAIIKKYPDLGEAK